MTSKTGKVETLATHIGNGIIDMDALWRRVRSPESPGGMRIVDSEADEIEAAWKEFRPGACCGVQTLEICSTALSSAWGVYSDGFVRKVTPIKRGAVITDLFPEDPEPEPQFERAA